VLRRDCVHLLLCLWFSGAQGEYAGLRVIKSYLESLGQSQRNVSPHLRDHMTFRGEWRRHCSSKFGDRMAFHSTIERLCAYRAYTSGIRHQLGLLESLHCEGPIYWSPVYFVSLKVKLRTVESLVSTSIAVAWPFLSVPLLRHVTLATPTVPKNFSGVISGLSVGACLPNSKVKKVKHVDLYSASS